MSKVFAQRTASAGTKGPELARIKDKEHILIVRKVELLRHYIQGKPFP